MKKVFLLVLIVFFLPALMPALAEEGIQATQNEDRDKPPVKSLFKKGQKLSDKLSATVGVSVSPLLSMSALGAYHYYDVPKNQRKNIAWHSSPKLWIPLFAVLGAVFLKDFFKTILPIPKPFFAPLDALDAVQNKLSGLIGLPFTLSSMFGDTFKEIGLAFQELSLISVAYAGESFIRTISDPLLVIVQGILLGLGTSSLPIF